jgi:hypothetical protein
MSGNPCLIVEWSAATDWPTLTGMQVARIDGSPLRIPVDARPTVMQPSRTIAEQEAKRLAAVHPDKRFAIFEAQAVATGVDVPTHVTVGGHVWASRKVPVLLEIDDSEIPF